MKKCWAWMNDNKHPHKGDEVRRISDRMIGIVTTVRERGVAGSACTYIDYIEVEMIDGTIVRSEPRFFEHVIKKRI
jgi:hypothetical protein